MKSCILWSKKSSNYEKNMNFAIDIAPLAGLLIGVNYWNSEMNDDFENPKYHSLQLCFGVLAIVITWATEREE